MILSKPELSTLVQQNKYAVTEATRWLSRDIDGRYENGENLPPLAIPGGDAGNLFMLMVAAETYGFSVDYDKARQSLVELVGGPVQFSIAGDYLRFIQANPKAYEASAELVEVLATQVAVAKKDGSHLTAFVGPHREGAVLMVSGDVSIFPQFQPQLSEHSEMSAAFIYHKSLINDRHRAWAKILVETGIVTLYNGLDHEYLYEVLSSVAEDHLFITLQQFGQNLPVYEVIFSEKKGFTLEERGQI